jgi:hypothetical protein
MVIRFEGEALDAAGVNVHTYEKAESAKDPWRMSILPKPHPRSGCFISGQRPEIKWHVSALRLSLYPEGI